MIREINTKFFTFNQNNSGGYFIINDDVAHYLIIEAQNAEEAIDMGHLKQMQNLNYQRNFKK